MLYMIRHGETMANANNQYLGVTDSALTEKGKKQHQKLIETLNLVKIDTIYSSPRERCQSLANCFKGSSIKIDERIAEINFGVFEQLTWQEAKLQYPEVWNEWIKNELTYRIPGGETQQEVQQRVKSFVTELMSVAEEQEVVIVTHGGVMTLLLCYLFKLETKHQWNFKIKNGSMVSVNIANGFAYMEI